MVAFAYRMPAAVAPGEVNRAHPFTIEPTAVDQALPPTGYGQAVVVDPTSQGVRPVQPGDTALTDVYGITVRPYPFQTPTAGAYGAQPLGPAAAQTIQAMDVLRAGYIMVLCNGAPKKGGQVFVWVAASAAPHVQGGFEAAATAGSTIALTSTKTTFNGGPDSQGYVEVAYNV